jgi:hypothetical protein
MVTFDMSMLPLHRIVRELYNSAHPTSQKSVITDEVVQKLLILKGSSTAREFLAKASVLLA